MPSNASSAAQVLIRHLRHRQVSGQETVYLTAEAKASLRALFLRARQRRRGGQGQTRPPASAPAPTQVEAPVRPVAAAARPAEPPSLTPSPKPTAELASEPASSQVYPKLPVAVERLRIDVNGASQEAKLASLKAVIAKDGEAHLPTLRDAMVFSVGNPGADLMIVGEAPGHEEERQQEPFVGPAGQLLTKIIQAMGVARSDVYISNIVKYRPALPNQGTGNRKPTPEEMAACLPYILAETRIVKPKVIVAAGATAAEGLTGQDMAVGRSRGKVWSWNGIPTVVTYHPSYLLHNQALSERRKVWEDMLLVMELLGLSITEKQRRFFSKNA